MQLTYSQYQFAKAGNTSRQGLSINSRLGYWRLASSPMLMRSLINEKLAQAGCFDFPARCELICKCTMRLNRRIPVGTHGDVGGRQANYPLAPTRFLCPAYLLFVTLTEHH